MININKNTNNNKDLLSLVVLALVALLARALALVIALDLLVARHALDRDGTNYTPCRRGVHSEPRWLQNIEIIIYIIIVIYISIVIDISRFGSIRFKIRIG